MCKMKSALLQSWGGGGGGNVNPEDRSDEKLHDLLYKRLPCGRTKVEETERECVSMLRGKARRKKQWV